MDTIKQRVTTALRRTHLLQFADTAMLVKSIFKYRKANRRFLASHPHFIPPPYHLAYDAYNHTSWQAYYEMGRAHARLIATLIKEHVREREIKVCEWGCGPARVIRHLATIEGFDKVELHGTDYNTNSIRWCKDTIGYVHFSKNGLEPPLPYGPATFDCIFAISIFTHLSEKMHHAWIRELFRTIKPDGILVFTTHGDVCAGRLSAMEKARYATGRIVIKDQIQEGKKHFAAYHPRKFIREVLLNDYNVIQHMQNPIEHQLEQEVWVVGKSR